MGFENLMAPNVLFAASSLQGKNDGGRFRFRIKASVIANAVFYPVFLIGKNQEREYFSCIPNY